jgi:hypothetical protein
MELSSFNGDLGVAGRMAGLVDHVRHSRQDALNPG